MRNENKCQLCSKKEKLCYSHIIPEFFYKPLYTDKHKFLAIPSNKERNIPKLQKGFREYLLCRKCEDQINKYETYSKSFLSSIFSSKGSPFAYKRIKDIAHPSSEALMYDNIDYKKFKLFLLSILWRASISSLPEFQFVDLGPHNEKIRDMIFNENPGAQTDYPCIIYFMEGTKNLTRSIHPSLHQKIEGHNCFRFLITNFLFIYYVSSHRKPEDVRHFAIKENGTLGILLLSSNDYKSLPEYRNAIYYLRDRDITKNIDK